MAEIWSDPIKRIMLIILALLETPAIIFLICAWIKAVRKK